MTSLEGTAASRRPKGCGWWTASGVCARHTRPWRPS